MNSNTQKEEFSYAYVYAVAAAAGYSFQIAPRPLDAEGVDVIITGLGASNSTRRPRLDVQRSFKNSHATHRIRRTSMIVTLRDPKILKTLEPPEIAAYLQSQGWQEQSRDGDKSSIWTRRNEAGEEYEILLPLKPEISGFSLRIYEVMETLEISENRSQIEILADLITSLPNTTIQGVVMQIQTPNVDKLSGEIALLGVVVDKLRKIQTSLADHDYIKAIKAYQERLPIVCTGDLIKENGHFILKNLRHFAIDTAID